DASWRLLGVLRPDAAGSGLLIGEGQDLTRLPDEVRVTLEGHPDVGQAVVMVRDDGAGGRALVAYAAGRDGTRPVAAELRAFLRERLPEHMVPSAFVVLDALPRTPAGKVDRRALPAPVAAIAPGAPAEAPRTGLEREVMAAWCDVLEVPAVGLHDNFFDRGGHSLLMVRLRQRLVERLARPVELLDLFTHPTVAGLAEHLAGAAPGAELEGARRGRDLAAAQRDAVLRLARSRGGRTQ
ncbi:MAG TPA: phosphopantetheine-binding protein, partial [Candidatus Dormibacteraeota bacterium]|nr:phosphopantetheine-binding protein [Candidatus Dormibacteraeota bacterium]